MVQPSLVAGWLHIAVMCAREMARETPIQYLFTHTRHVLHSSCLALPIAITFAMFRRLAGVRRLRTLV